MRIDPVARPRAARDDDQARAHHWFLSPEERGNPDTRIDDGHGAAAWTTGNLVRPRVHGADYFSALDAELNRAGPGDLVLFTDWRGDPDEQLRPGGPTVSQALAAAARRGADVRGLVWRSHLDRFAFSAAENRHLGEEIEDAGGQCLLDQRVRWLGSHHQKLVVVRHGSSPDDNVAFVGGIDLCHGRRDDAEHRGDPQPLRMARVYGPRPPWHDVQLEVRGPAVADLETTFRERWADQAPLSLNPVHLVGELVHREQTRGRPLPPQTPAPAPHAAGVPVQVLRTYPRRTPAYPFARQGERSVARAYLKALGRARRLVYLEDQYLWSPEVARVLADALAREPLLRMVIVVPAYPDQDGRVSMPPNLVGRDPVLRMLHRAGPGRVAVCSPENRAGVPVYVHAKVSVVDDEWACVGSDNVNRRSWTHDSELSAAFVDSPDGGAAQQLRLTLTREHLDASSDDGLVDAEQWYDAVVRSVTELESWHRAGGHGERPPGRLRPYGHAPLGALTRTWARVLYDVAFDPDARPWSAKRRGWF